MRGPWRRAITVGMTGLDVGRVQRSLGLSVSGMYTPGNAAAVRGFQRMRGLPASGVVDEETWAALAAVPQAVDQRGLRRGQSGSEVAQLQRALGVTVTGRFDPATEAAVRRYQRIYGLEVDGTAGRHTLESLRARGSLRRGA
jgi:peptidoglycan hydrolase-like protein with peptidoglycan-binding domain